jgi:hypothetical protein
MKQRSIKVDGVVYIKTALFGNWKAKNIFRNRKRYNRKRDKSTTSND